MNIGSLPEAIRNADQKVMAVMLAGAFLAHLIFGKSEIQRKQEQLDKLLTWGSWTVRNCAPQKPGKPLYVCNDGRRFYAMPEADRVASLGCLDDIKTCARVPDVPTMLPAVAGR